MEQRLLRLDDVARRMGVHYQTAYRWVRAGRLSASKVAGSYVVTEAAFEAFRSSHSAPKKPPSPGSLRLDRQSKAMADALFAGDETAAGRIARNLVREGTSVASLIEQVIVPPLVEIGASWHAGELDIYVEHRASAIVGRILGELSPNPRGRRRGRCVVAAISGDRHSLPTMMATAALREDHWTVEHLGADMPVEEIERFVATHDIDLVVLSATGEIAPLARAAANRIEATQGVSVLLGGSGQTLSDLVTSARQVNGPQEDTGSGMTNATSSEGSESIGVNPTDSGSAA